MATLDKSDARPNGSTIRNAIQRDRSVQKLNRADVEKADAPDSKGPGGIGVFGDFKPENIYGGSVTIEGSVRGQIGVAPKGTGALHAALTQASGVAPKQGPLPEMAGRIFKAFTDAEGREPGPEDSEFWKAIVAAHEMCGEQAADEVIAAAFGARGETVQKAADAFVERFRKELGRDVPAWLKNMEEKYG